MATYHRMLQTLSRVQSDSNKIRQCSRNVDLKIFELFNNKNPPNNNDNNNELINYLKNEKYTLSSINTKLNVINPNSNSSNNLNCSTPSKSHKRARPNFSSTKKQRPYVRKTPLRPKIKPNNNNNNNNNNILSVNNNILNERKEPQKRLIHFTPNANNKKRKIDTKPKPLPIDLDNDGDDEENENPSDSDDENMSSSIKPSNLVMPKTSFVTEKLAEIKKYKKEISNKPQKILALKNAKKNANKQRKIEQERARKREENKRLIEERKKLKRQQKEEEEKEKRRREQRNKNKSNFIKPKTNRIGNRMNNKSGIKVPRKVNRKFQIAANSNHNTVNNNNNHNNNRKWISSSSLRRTTSSNKQEKKEYAISDYDSCFSDSDLDEENCGKYIPEWARKSKPKSIQKRQKIIDPDTIFGRLHNKTCDLEIVFKEFPSKSKYRNRSASGDWSKDQISWMEENNYKKEMGWI